MRERQHRIPLPTLDAVIAVRFRTESGEVTEFAVQLLVETADEQRPVRLYDTAHGELEMHRYDEQGSKLPAEKITGAGDDWSAELPTVIEEIKSGYERMIRGD